MANPFKIKTWTFFFKKRHIKQRNLQYKRLKNRKKGKSSNSNAIEPLKALILKSINEKSNECLQNNGYLFYFSSYHIIRLDLNRMKNEWISFTENENIYREVIICAIPNQLFLCINCGKGQTFIIDQNLQISDMKNIKPRDYCMLLYLDGLIYAFTGKYGYYTKTESYDYKNNKWKLMANITYDVWGCVVFERKIIVSPHQHDTLKVFDPFSNSVSDIFNIHWGGIISLLVANDRCYCILSGTDIWESSPRDYFKWTWIGKNRINVNTFAQYLFSLYNGSIYFIGIPYAPSLYEFNLQTHKITLIDHLCKKDR